VLCQMGSDIALLSVLRFRLLHRPEYGLLMKPKHVAQVLLIWIINLVVLTVSCFHFNIVLYTTGWNTSNQTIQLLKNLPADNCICELGVKILTTRYSFWRHSDDRLQPVHVRNKNPASQLPMTLQLLSNQTVIRKYCKFVCLRPNTNTLSTKLILYSHQQ
jgi:hypothetical protein